VSTAVTVVLIKHTLIEETSASLSGLTLCRLSLLYLPISRLGDVNVGHKANVSTT
jgi:hypothetical protein